MTRRLAFGVATIALVVAVGGCAEPIVDPAVSPQASPPLSPSVSVPSSASSSIPTNQAKPSSSVAPTIDRRPSGPPREPTDKTKKTSWVVGTVTAGGSGPCYGLVTDDGTQYALHSTGGAGLTKGSRVRVNTRATQVRIYCGPGKLVEMIAAEPVR